MRKSLLKTASGLAAVAALLILPSTAPAATVVPPGNSAATQYTETLPTSGGNAEVNGTPGKGRTPAKTLGSKTTKKLEEHGAEGEAVAAFAAETTPSAQSASPVAIGGAGDEGAKHGSAVPTRAASDPPARLPGAARRRPSPRGNSAVSVPSGSSGIGEVISYATGATSGEMGILLPLILVGALIWALSPGVAPAQRQPGDLTDRATLTPSPGHRAPP